MNCTKLKIALLEKLGTYYLDAWEEEHLSICPECRTYYESMIRMEKRFRDCEIEPLSSTEFAVVQERLDQKINKYQIRAMSFYKLSLRLGTTLATVMLVAFISLLPRLDDKPALTDLSEVQEISYYTDMDFDDEMLLEEGYLDLIIPDYIYDNGFFTGESILGELTADELDYLNSRIDKGSIL